MLDFLLVLLLRPFIALRSWDILPVLVIKLRMLPVTYSVTMMYYQIINDIVAQIFIQSEQRES